MRGGVHLERGGSERAETDAARKRAAVEMIARYEQSLRRTARRFSFDAQDAEDAYQRALEIVLTKAPTTDVRDLIRWTQTVTKHEALAVRESRERLLGPRRSADTAPDPLSTIPASGAGPDEQAERHEIVARSREALRALKPAELRALSLLASGHSYAEIAEITGFSRTKVNRVLAEGRNRFRALYSSSEDGSRCRELGPLLSAFCDGEASASDAVTVREHLRACARCRSTMRAYRAAPRIAASLVPALALSRSLLERLRDQLSELVARLPGRHAGDPAVQQATAGTGSGASVLATAKLAAICAGATGVAAICAATGMVPTPLADDERDTHRPAERVAAEPARASEAREEPSKPAKQAPATEPEPERAPQAEEEATVEPIEPLDAVEYEPPQAPEPPPPSAGESETSSPSSDSAAGEFGP